MRDLLSMFVTIGLFVLFINLLPTLIWLFFVGMIAVLLYSAYQRYKFNQQQSSQRTNMYQGESNTTREGSIKPDVIDVEYTESEEEIS